MIEILPSEKDDSEFILIIEKILKNFVQSHLPKEVYVIKIDSWFDFKWRAFMGKYLGAAGFWNKEQLRIPPFIPDRVLEQIYFQKLNEEYVKRVHADLHIYQTSSNNITGKRKLVTSSGSRLFCWFSSNTKNTQSGSLMFYHIKPEDSDTFYVSFLKKKNWQIYKTDQISRNEVSNLMT